MNVNPLMSTSESGNGAANMKAFVGLAAFVVAMAVIAWILPLYSITTSAGSAYSLTALGWAGDATVPWILGILPAQDYSSLVWSILIAAGGAGILLIAAWKQGTATKSAWGTLAAVALVPVISASVMLATDNFPMVYVVATSSAQVAVTASWGVPLWGLTLATSLAVAGTVQHPPTNSPTGRNDPPRPPASTAGALDLDDIEYAILERARNGVH
jgi:hypothetical protein